MAIPISVKQVACERLLHFHPKRAIARELSVSHGVALGRGLMCLDGSLLQVGRGALVSVSQLLITGSGVPVLRRINCAVDIDAAS